MWDIIEAIYLLGGWWWWWYESAEILTRINFFLYDRRLILQNRDQYWEFMPFTPRSRTQFHTTPRIIQDLTFLDDNDNVKAVDITFRNDTIFTVAQHSTQDILPTDRPSTINSIVDLYNQLPDSLRRLIGNIDWPDPECLTRLATALQEGKVIGASDGSDRKNVYLSPHAWILQAKDGCELIGWGPVDGTPPYRTIHTAELQGQTAMFLILRCSLNSTVSWNVRYPLYAIPNLSFIKCRRGGICSVSATPRAAIATYRLSCIILCTTWNRWTVSHIQQTG